MSTSFNVYPRGSSTSCHSASTEGDAHEWARKNLGHGYRVEPDAPAKLPPLALPPLALPPLVLPTLAAAVIGYLASLVLFIAFKETRPSFIYETPPFLGAVFLSVRYLPLLLPIWVWRRQRRKRAEFHASQKFIASRSPPAIPTPSQGVVEPECRPAQATAILAHPQSALAATNSNDVRSGTPPADIASSTPMEEHWAHALAEYEGPTRRPGLYARAFAEEGGVEAATKAKYLAARAQELADEHKRLAVAREAEDERQRAEQLASWEKQASDFEKLRRSRALTSWGTCSNCNWMVPIDAPMCHRCGATFDEGSAWQLRSIPIDERRALVEEELGRQRSITGRQLSDVVAMAESAPSMLTIYVHGDTLLHKAAEFNMREEVKHLLALGADPAKTNAQGKTAVEVAASESIVQLIRGHLVGVSPSQ